MNGLSAIVGKGDLMRKLSFPRYVIVVAGSFSALINLAINLLVVGIFMYINGVALTWNVLWLLPLIVELFVFSLSIAFLLGALYVKFRDINYIWEVVLQAGFSATPVLYPIQMVIEKSAIAAQIMMLNPVAQVIQDARAVVVTADTITVSALFNNPFVQFIPIAIVAATAIISITYFKKKSPGFAEDI
jgi:ABC-2 type transport system permease protein